MNADGISAITSQTPPGHTNWFGIGLIQIGSWYLMSLTVAGAQQQMIQHTWSARNRRVAMFGTFLAGVVITGYGILTAAAVMIANARVPHRILDGVRLDVREYASTVHRRTSSGNCCRISDERCRFVPVGRRDVVC